MLRREFEQDRRASDAEVARACITGRTVPGEIGFIEALLHRRNFCRDMVGVENPEPTFDKLDELSFLRSGHLGPRQSFGLQDLAVLSGPKHEIDTLAADDRLPALFVRQTAHQFGDTADFIFNDINRLAFGGELQGLTTGQ